MDRRFFFKNTIHSFGLLCLSPSVGETWLNGLNPEKKLPEFPDLNQPEIIPIPDQIGDWPEFRNALNKWRKAIRKKNGYEDSLYDRSDFKWVPSAYNCYFLMMYDELFYNWKEGKYSIEKFLADRDKEFGRIDMIVLWHAYPRIGLDERNQFDFYRDMPGGLIELRKLSGEFRRKGIKVFLNYNPWDTGTRREGIPDIEVLTGMVKAIDADGIFLDTMAWGAKEFREKLDGAKPGVVLESELALPVENIFDNHMSWAQWFVDSEAPGILRNKWFERRHMQHGISRWQRDRTKELHTAWMNGSGIMIWENVFGQWVGWNKRDKSILRSMSPIQKRYSSLFSGEGWIPMSGQTLKKNVYSNLWFNQDIRLWTLVNRSEEIVEGDLLRVDGRTGERYFDLIQGKEILPVENQQKVVLNGKLIPRGIGCFIAGKLQDLGTDFQTFLTSQSGIFKTSDFSTEFPEIQAQKITPVSEKNKIETLEGMVQIPAFKGKMEVVFRKREVGFYQSIDPSFVNIGAPSLHQNIKFTVEVNLTEFMMDETPVTNARYAEFLKATAYVPKVIQNFLKHWNDGKFPSGKENHPVVYVDLNDARAFAEWAGKRLPTEFEWQFAGQGFGNIIYPWGAEMNTDFCNSGKSGDTMEVKAYPDGKSVFGCFDMCGNTWEMTDSEYSDGRSRFCMLKGGTFYQAQGSQWYFDGGPQPMNFTAKQLLIYPGIDRCSTVGFRCAADRKL